MVKKKSASSKKASKEIQEECCSTSCCSGGGKGMLNKFIFLGLVLTLILLFSIHSNLKDLEERVSLLTGDVVNADMEVKAKSNIETSATDQGEPLKGDPDAPVTITEWSDFECPFCARFYTETLSQIEEQYVKTGKVNVVYRHFPLSNHPNAQKAAEATECAHEQGKFWEMHDLMFEKGARGGVASYKQFASDLGLDTKQFDECLDSGKMQSEVENDLREGANSGIRGTPGFLINGQLVSGAQPFSAFQQVIEAELNK